MLGDAIIIPLNIVIFTPKLQLLIPKIVISEAAMKKGTDIFYERHHDENKNICIFADGAHCDLHFHRSIEVLLLTEGEVKAEVGEQTFLAQMDEIIFVHNYYPHRLTLLGGPFRKIVLIIPPSFSDDFDRAFRQSTLPALLDDREFNRTLLPLFESLAAEKQGSSLILKGYLNVLFGKLLDHYPTVPIRLDRNVDLMARILRYIDCHYTEKLTLDSLAQEFGYSKYYFSRLFNTYVPGSLSNYVNLIRLREFNRLAKAGTDNVCELAFACGFESMSTFYRYAKQYNRK